MPSKQTLPDLLSPFLAEPAQAAVVTDFDGTLAPIIDEPSRSQPLPGVPSLLRLLARRYARVAVVSGRPAGFLVDRLELRDHDADGIVVSGLYGLEESRSGVIDQHPAAAPWKEAIERAAADAIADAPEGIYVERKGLSVTVHVRTAPGHAEWAKSWTEAYSHTTGLALHPGRMSWELRPPVKIDKGTVVLHLLERMKAACFCGDDVGDLPAFDALDRLQAEGVHTLRVGVRSDEAPPELIERADVLVDGPHGVVDVLRLLAS